MHLVQMQLCNRVQNQAARLIIIDIIIDFYLLQLNYVHLIIVTTIIIIIVQKKTLKSIAEEHNYTFPNIFGSFDIGPGPHIKPIH